MDRKIKVSIDACLPHMITAETIYSNFGAVILWENTALNDQSINKLRDFGIQTIGIYESSIRSAALRNAPSVEAEALPFNEAYERDTDEFKSLLFHLAAGETVSLDSVVKIADSVYSRRNSNREIVDCITQIRKVDEYTYYHSVNVSLLSMLIGKWLRLSHDDIYILAQAGLLHDIGKGQVSVDIITKPGKLTAGEFDMMKKHSEYGYYLVQNIDGINSGVAETIFYHHEREDGSGYPMGLQGDQIPKFAKIIAVADTFDAMTANRTYKIKESPFRVFELMQNGCFGYLDPVILDTFLANISHYFVGSKARLKDGRVAEIIYINRQQYGRPVLKVGEEYVDMSVARNVTIEELI